MSVRSLARFKWPLMLLVLGVFFGAAYWVNHEMREERAAEQAGEKVQSKRRAKDGVVDLTGTKIAATSGLESEPAKATTWAERVTVYGRVVPNPRAMAEIRSSFAGTLRAASESAWPAPGQRVTAGQVLGWIDIRVAPQDRLELQNKLNDARLKQKGAEEVVKIQQDRVDRLKLVTSQELISRGGLDDALVMLAEARTQLASATAAAELWQKAVEEIDRRGRDRSAWSQPLTAPADGEVTDLLGRPGMAVEAGGLIAQLVDFHRPLVRLDLPPELLAAGPPLRLALSAIAALPAAWRGVPNRPELADSAPTADAVLIGPAPRLDATTQFVGYWYDVVPAPGKRAGPEAVWRPGLQVKAFVKARGAQEQPAVSVPASAVLYHAGWAFVYVQTEPGKYLRREVRLLGREGDHWVVALWDEKSRVGVAPDEAVVFRQPQVLLSEEFREAGE